MNYNNLNLKKNPFEDITPSIEDIIWAGMPEIKRKIEKIYRTSNQSRNIIINWGPWGGGKTHAAYFFIKNYNDNIFQMYIRTPKDSATGTEQLFKEIIDSISFSTINLQIQSFIEKMGEGEFLNYINKKIQSEPFSKAIVRLGSEDESIKEIMEKYLYSGVTKTELKQVKLTRILETSSDYIKFLSGILNCFIDNPNKKWKKIIIWIDEMEDLIYYNSKHYRMFTQSIRDLCDRLNRNFILFMNFTLAEPEENTIKMLIGEALWSRINYKIRFNELSNFEGMLYCKELISYAQINKSKEFIPFTRESIKTILKSIPEVEMTPREINKRCSEVLHYALEKNITKLTKDLVSDSQVTQ